MVKILSLKQENNVIKIGIVLYWWFFWLLNVVDKFLYQEKFWLGKDRLTQFINYFSSIGINNTSVASGFLVFVTLLEIIALIYLTYAVYYLTQKDKRKTRHYLFLGILLSLIVFSFFAIGDQIFGDRVELLEHSIYWVALVLSWFVYTHSDK